MRPASIVCMAAMTLILVPAVTATGEAPASPWNDTPASSTPSAAPATPALSVAPAAPAPPAAAPAPANPSAPAGSAVQSSAEPAAAPGAVAPPATTVAGPDPKVVAELQGTNSKLFNRYSKDVAAAVKSKTDEIVRKCQPLLVAADAKIEQLKKGLPTADRAGWDAETKRNLREQAAAEILIVQLAKEENIKLHDAEVAAAVAAGRAKTLRLRKVFEDHKRALFTGNMLTEDAMTADYDAAMKLPPDQAAQGGAPSEDSAAALCTVLNPTLVAVDFEMGSGADRVAGRIPSRTHVEFKMKKGQQQLIAKAYPDNRARPLNRMVMVERVMLLVFWMDAYGRIDVYDRTAELLPGAAGSMAPGGAPVPPMEAKRGVMPPPPAPPKPQK